MAGVVGKKAGLNWYPEPRYDTVIFPAGALVTATYFSLPLGQIIAGGAVAKTTADTNLRNAAMIGKPNQFELHGFAVEPAVAPTAAGPVTLTADWALIYNTGVFTFQCGGNKNLLEVPLSRIPVAGGPTGFGTTVAGGAVMVNGVPFASNFYAFHKLITDEATKKAGKVNLLLDGDTNFSVTITYPIGAGITLTTATRVRVYMIGYYGSAIQ